MLEEDEVFTFFPTYIDSTYPILKSFGVIGDRDEDTLTTNALLYLATISFELQTLAPL